MIDGTAVAKRAGTVLTSTRVMSSDLSIATALLPQRPAPSTREPVERPRDEGRRFEDVLAAEASRPPPARADAPERVSRRSVDEKAARAGSEADAVPRTEPSSQEPDALPAPTTVAEAASGQAGAVTDAAEAAGSQAIAEAVDAVDAAIALETTGQEAAAATAVPDLAPLQPETPTAPAAGVVVTTTLSEGETEAEGSASTVADDGVTKAGARSLPDQASGVAHERARGARGAERSAFGQARAAEVKPEKTDKAAATGEAAATEPGQKPAEAAPEPAVARSTEAVAVAARLDPGSTPATFAQQLDAATARATGQPAAAPVNAGAPSAEAERSATLQTLPIEIGVRALKGASEFTIRLDPADLGKVEVKLAVDEDGSVKARIVVDRSETLNLLNRDARTLERAFDQAGLKTSPDSLEFSLRGDGTGRDAQGRHFAEEMRTTTSGRNAETQGEPPVLIDAAALAQRYLGRSITGLDIRI